MARLSDPGPLVQEDAPVAASLLAAVCRGDEVAWRALIALYSRRVYALARSRCRRADLAEEVTQSVFVTVASKVRGGGYTEQGRFESWLFRVAMNRIRDEVRRQRRQATPADPASFAGLQAIAPAFGPEPARLAELREALQMLPEADREVIELRHHADLSFKQIAELVGEPLGTLLARHHRALRKLKDLIHHSDDGEAP